MIRKLPQSVINKIAAGQVIQRPYNVIKELLENSLDAGATQVRVVLAQSGIQSIEVTDNGKGIAVQDFPLLCERFATSKLTQLKDLQSLDSFGFRGEALASLSYVSNLEVSSRRSETQVGYRCAFKQERMVGQPEPISMNAGTRVLATDLFAGLQTRRMSISIPEEKRRILKLVGHLALHYYQVRFGVETEKGSDFSGDYRGLRVSEAKMKAFQALTKLPFDKFGYLQRQPVEDARSQAILSKLNTIRGKTLLLNVNNRIVESPQIFRAVEKAYSECYQSIHQDNESFFVYLSIEVKPDRLDCNQHPNKQTVGFFHPEPLYEALYTWLLNQIKEETSVKNISTNIPQKPRLTFTVNKDFLVAGKGKTQEEKESKSQEVKQKDTRESGYEKNRTDSLQLPLGFYLGRKDGGRKLSFRIMGVGDQGDESGHIRDFFKQVSYVGCFNLNFLFIQYQNKLQFLNILPFIDSFLREWLRKNDLIIQEISEGHCLPDLEKLISNFLEDKNLTRKVDLPQLIRKIILAKDYLESNFGIGIHPNSEGTNAYLVCFPILDACMSDCLSQEELAYFLCRLFNKQITQEQSQSYFIQFLTSLFQQASGVGNVKVEEGAKRQLSPMNDKYSNFLKSQVMTLLKTKCRHYKDIKITDYLKQMLDLKEIYKVFQRC